jgi:lipid A 3-O-deacylase PagL
VIDLVILQSASAIVAVADGAGRPGWPIVRSGAAWERELRLPRHLPSASGHGTASPPWDTEQDQPEARPPAAGPPDPGPVRGSEWQIGVGHGWSVDLLQSAGGRRYVPVTISWGRDLMRDAGPSVLRGRLTWGVEAMPLYWQYRPTETVGVAVSPLVWRWRFVPRTPAAAFGELAFGGLFTSDPVPEGTEAANFLTHGGFGVRWLPGRRVSWVTAYRFQHISNGNQLTTNPGVNAHILWVGVSIVR